EIELQVGAIHLEVALAGEADGAAQKLQVAYGDARAADRERGVHLLEEGPVRPAQAEKLQEVKQQRNIEDAAAIDVDAAVAVQGVHATSLAGQVEAADRLALQLRIGPELIVPAEIVQVDLRRRQVHLVAQSRAEFEAQGAGDVAIEQRRPHIHGQHVR